MNAFTITIAIALILIILSVVAIATVGRRKKEDPQCACFEIPGDNVSCPIAEHRSMAKVWMRNGKRSGGYAG